MIKKEYLILEKQNNGRSFEIYKNKEDKINALKLMRKPTIVMIIFLGIMLLMNYIGSIPQHRQNLYEFKLFTKSEEPILLIFGIVEVLLFINIIRFNVEISRIKKEIDIEE